MVKHHKSIMKYLKSYESSLDNLKHKIDLNLLCDVELENNTVDVKSISDLDVISIFSEERDNTSIIIDPLIKRALIYYYEETGIKLKASLSSR